MRFQMLRRVTRPVLNSLARTKQKLFSPRLLLYTNTGITACLSVAGDVMQQWYQAQTRKKLLVLDQTRTTRMAGTGLLIGPVVHYWYIFLDGWLPGRTFGVLCKKVLMDQLICSPIYLSIFMLSLCYMENKTWTQAKADIVDKGPQLMLAEWFVWPPAQFINFFFLPTQYRVLYDNTISLAFDFFWSYVWYEMDKDEPADPTV
ncbi:mpv17-like protein 2 [Babylonia areolata]|uniref:mpv17-like protein 2 n=1 Tax=Babylonia areolata TaxID=304850 RepID=UPI003FD25504